MGWSSFGIAKAYYYGQEFFIAREVLTAAVGFNLL